MTCEIINRLFLAALCSQLLSVMSVLLIVLLLSSLELGPPRLPPRFGSSGVPLAAEGVGGSSLLSVPLWELQLSVRVWGAAPDSRGAPARFVWVVCPPARRYACRPRRVRAEWWHGASRPLLQLLAFDFYQAAASCSPIVTLEGVFLSQLFPR